MSAIATLPLVTASLILGQVARSLRCAAWEAGACAGRVVWVWRLQRRAAPLPLGAAAPVMRRRLAREGYLGPTGGNVRPAAISPNTMLDNMLAAQCAVDDPSTEFPKMTSTGNIPPELCHKIASSGPLCRQSASAEMENGICCLVIASSRTFPPAGPCRIGHKYLSQTFPCSQPSPCQHLRNSWSLLTQHSPPSRMPLKLVYTDCCPLTARRAP